MSENGGDLGSLKRSTSPQVIEEPTSKKAKIESPDGVFNVSKQYSDSVDLLSEAFARDSSNDDKLPTGTNMHYAPFKVMELNDFLDDNGVVDKLRQSISDIGKFFFFYLFS